MRTKECVVKYRGAYFLISFRNKLGYEKPLHIMVSKKGVQTAVERNKIKRRVRELWRASGIGTHTNIQTQVQWVYTGTKQTYASAKEDFQKAVSVLEKTLLSQ